MDSRFPLKQVLSVAKVHPFYAKDVEYPPSPESVRLILDNVSKDSSTSDTEIDLGLMPLTTKEDFITGGGSGGMPMLFATDAAENRKHRYAAGALIKTCGLIEPADLVLSLHTSGKLYRALDLTTELIENAGGSVLCAGHAISMEDAKQKMEHYRANVIAGDGSQVLQFANYIASLPAEDRAGLNVTKVLYTSEPLTKDQRAVVCAALGQPRIVSLLGSAEAGPWAVANSELTGEPDDDSMDFIFDTRMMNIEILPPSATDGLAQKPVDGSGADTDAPASRIQSLPDGETGIIVQTSLSRLRNPLIRYITGDVGSLHPFRSTKLLKSLDNPSDAQYLRILRLYGRDRRFSFEWFGEYFEFHTVNKLITESKGWGVIQWQLILEKAESKETQLEVRLYRSNVDDGQSLPNAAISEALIKLFVVYEANDNLFKITFVSGLDGFERSSTAGKVMKFVDRTH
ncbi:hypothetical protein Dda_0119 [Drechslerella dactyloides]|uniref:Uncharacterized protein n=1 Tax=Drechslerella dactyloides TaxID=74499 RepID=A0AAD6NLM6_DREDA|nr:hypothetical protein Dda_0119 [Drechslerella dactyloides]